MKQITVLSGKGGVGKSSISASLAVTLSKNYKIICADCDVDASNLALVFGIREKDFTKWEKISTSQKAVFDLERCNGCKKCLESCYFNAIEWADKKPKLKEFSCEGCGVCRLVCPMKAVRLVDVDNAKIGYGLSGYGFDVVSAQLEMGEAGSGKVVAAVKSMARDMADGCDFMIVDAAAGIGCPVIASVTGSDYVVAVTEPTPSGFSDLKRALEMVRHFRINAGIIINKYDINRDYSEQIKSFAEKNNINIIAEIPYDKSFTDALVALMPIVTYEKKYERLFEKIAEKVIRET